MITIFTAVGMVSLRHVGMFEFLEMAAYDWTLRLQPPPKSTDPRVVLVTISEEDIRQLGQWPLTDETVAQLLDRLTGSGARVIGLDIYRDFEIPPGTDQLNQTFHRHKNIITVMKFPSPDTTGIPGPPVLRETDQIGFNDILTDSGGIVRRGLLFLDNGDISATSFALLSATRYLKHEDIVLRPDERNPDHVKIGGVTLPPLRSDDGAYINIDHSGYQFLIRYHPAQPTFSEFSFSEVLKRQIPPQKFQDKIVLIGVKAESVKDAFITPYSQGLGNHQLMAGVEVHAHMVSQLLRMALEGEQPVQVLSEWQERGWIILWCLIGGMTGLLIRGFWPFLLIFLGWTGFLIGVAYFSMQADWWIPAFPPVLGLLTTGGLVSTAMSWVERDQRKLLMDLFSKHVSPEVADMIWQEREHFFLEGRLRTQKQIVTALFADLEGFTPIAESLPPPQLMEWLNTYMETMVNVIMTHHGVVDDYYGDAIKANFGVPFARIQESEIQHDAQNAVRSAINMRSAIIRLNQDLTANSLPAVRLRIGIFTGPVVAGSLGSSQRLKFTTIGDAVNIAARLESLDLPSLTALEKADPCRILIGESTHAYLEGKWKTEDLGKVALKGKEQHIHVYRVLPSEDHTSD